MIMSKMQSLEMQHAFVVLQGHGFIVRKCRYSFAIAVSMVCVVDLFQGLKEKQSSLYFRYTIEWYDYGKAKMSLSEVLASCCI